MAQYRVEHRVFAVDLLEICSAIACFLADRFGLRVTAALNISTFTGVRTFFALPPIVFCVESMA